MERVCGKSNVHHTTYWQSWHTSSQCSSRPRHHSTHNKSRSYYSYVQKVEFSSLFHNWFFVVILVFSDRSTFYISLVCCFLDVRYVSSVWTMWLSTSPTSVPLLMFHPALSRLASSLASPSWNVLHDHCLSLSLYEFYLFYCFTYSHVLLKYIHRHTFHYLL